MKNKSISKLGLILTLTLTGCEGLPVVSGGASSSTASTTTSTSDVRRIVSVGESLSFNQLTAGGSDVAVNPLTSLPAVAYNDRGSNFAQGSTAVGGLKYAYQDSSGAWNIEVVDINYGTAACGSGTTSLLYSYCVGAPATTTASNSYTSLRMAFKSDGTPVIAYVYGFTGIYTGSPLARQIRVAERSATTGRWTVSVAYSSTGTLNAVTTDAMKAVTLLLDAADRPHITFSLVNAVTASTGALMYLFRSSDGIWSQTNVSTSITGSPTTATLNSGFAYGALAQGPNHADSVRCATGGNIYVTAATQTAAATASPTLFRCSVDSTTGACTSWSFIHMTSTGAGLAAGQFCVGGTGCATAATVGVNAGNITSITIDAATQRLVYGLSSTTNSNLQTFTSPAAGTCDATIANLTSAGWTPLVVAAATAGGFGFRLKSSTVANNANYVAYQPVAGTSFVIAKQTGPAAAWGNATTVRTSTFYSSGFGFQIDPTYDILHASFGTVPAGTAGTIGHDLEIASGPLADVAGTASIFPITTVDNTNTVFPTTPLVPVLSAATAPSGLMGYAYFYIDPLAANFVDSKLYYGFKSGSSTAPTFASNLVMNMSESSGAGAGALSGTYPSLAYDSNSNPVIAFYNGTAAEQNLNIARSFNGGVSFDISKIDDTTAITGLYPHVQVSGSTIGVAYQDSTNSALKFARYTPTTGWRRFIVDGFTGATGTGCSTTSGSGAYARLAFTSTGAPVIAYQRDGSLYIAYSSSAASSTSFTWTCSNLDPGVTKGEGIDLVLTSTDQPRIVHYETAGSIRYVACTSGISTCMANPLTTFVASSLASTGLATTVFATRPSMAYSSTTGITYVTYYSQTLEALMMTSLPSGSSTWSAAEVLDSNTTGNYGQSAVGQYGQLLLNSSNLPTVFYRSYENWLRYFSRQ